MPSEPRHLDKRFKMKQESLNAFATSVSVVQNNGPPVLPGSSK